jgi:hypothetical protein
MPSTFPTTFPTSMPSGFPTTFPTGGWQPPPPAQPQQAPR